MQDLLPQDRLRLLRFACAFAWADLKVAPEERRFIADLLDRLQLSDEERAQVAGWLAHPPDPESIDPMDIPPAHRRLFARAALQTIRADHVMDVAEIETFRIFQALMSGVDDLDEDGSPDGDGGSCG